MGGEDWVEDYLVYMKLGLGTKFFRRNCLVITYCFLSKHIQKYRSAVSFKKKFSLTKNILFGVLEHHGVEKIMLFSETVYSFMNAKGSK